MSNAQYTQIGAGGFTNANFGPITTDTLPAFYSRFAYIYPSATLTNLNHEDTITALGFRHRGFDSLRGNCNMKIYLKSTSQPDFGTAALNWLAEARNGMTLVYSGNPKDIIGNSPSDAVFQFNQTTKFPWDTAGASINLEILIEYTQTTNQEVRMNWYHENSFFVPGFVSANESKFIFGSSTSGMDSITNSNSIIKPTLRIYHPVSTNDLETIRLYSLGTVPILMDTPDSIKVVIANIGKDTVFSRKVFLEVSGANSYEDSVVISSIAPYTNDFVYFTNYEPANLGTETLTVTLGDDDVITNNSIFKDRIANYNIYSHSDPFASNTGGVGFNGSTGDFVAKFYVGGTSHLNQIKVDFNLGGRDFQLGVWDDDGTGGLPGTELFMSDSSISVGGTFIMPVLPKIQISGGFYIGIRQTTTTNVAFSFQNESPVRPNTFFFTAPAGDTNWTPFSPGFDFNFNVQPRLQVANDLAVLDILSPVDGDSIKYSLTDSIDVIARFINFGYQNQTSFITRMEMINRFGQVEELYEEIISLQSADTAVVNFGKYDRYHLGHYIARATVVLNTDSVQDNNSQEIEFDFIKDHDVAVDIIFSPTTNDTFEMNREPFQPTVRVINYGVIDQTGFNVVGELVNSFGNVIAYQQKTISLVSQNSVITTFDPITIPDEGTFIFRSYTTLFRDSFPINDSSKVTIHSIKVDDLEIKLISKPEHLKRYAKNTTLRPFITYRNDGRSNQDSTYFYASVYGEDNEVIYTDTNMLATTFASTGQVLFDNLMMDSLGDFRFTIEVEINDDQKPVNDTMSALYSVVTANDIKLVDILEPIGVIVKGSSSGSPRLIVRNNGINNTVNAKISMNIENNQSVSVLSDTISINLNGFVTDTFSFSTLTFNEIGDYYVEVINNWSLEDEPGENDTIRSTYIIRYGSDIGIVKHFDPVDKDTIELGEEVFPSLQINNYGIDTGKDVSIEINITHSGISVYRDTFSLDFLSPNRANNFLSTKVFSTSIPGEYILESQILANDDNLDNNALSSTFYAILRKDVSVVSSIFPVESQQLLYKNKYKPEVTISNNGLDDLTGVEIQCLVTIDAIGIYDQSKTVDIASGETVQIAFDSTLYYDNLAQALIRFTVESVDDQIASNDTIIRAFEFVRGLNVNSHVFDETLVYPNPFSNSIIVEAKEGISSIRLVDLNGKLLFEAKSLNTNSYEIHLNVPVGNYILEIQSGDKIERFPMIKSFK